MLIAVIILGVLCVALLAFIVFKLSRPVNNDAAMLLKADMTELNKSMSQLREGLQTQLTQQLGTSNKQMAAQFAASAKIIEDVTRKLTELDRTNKNVGDIANELKSL